MNILSGMKTYIVAAVAVLAAIIGLFNGELTLLQTLSAIGLATGLFGDRMILKVREAIANPSVLTKNPMVGMVITHLGTALTILTAILGGINGQQDPVTTISLILSALGINVLGLGAKKAVAPVSTT
mgnify:CR=1 FL=1|tara:strand:- start:200 stop:580 length:381 start_codon:yes stop_codon:yes gene_type:complete